MTKYVLVYACEVPGSVQNVILVGRVKADWQQGRLNLPGGHIEEGESVQQAAARELQEETSLVALPNDIKVVGLMGGEDWMVFVCFAPYRPTIGGRQQYPVAREEQAVLKMPYREALTDPRLIPNLQIVIPLCMSQVEGWVMTPAGSDLEWNVQLKG